MKELLIEITDNCPLNCIYCSSNCNMKNNNYIKQKHFYMIILDAVSIGIEKIKLSGGEPFQHPLFLNFMSFILQNNLYLDIYTSGNVNKGYGLEKLPFLNNKIFKNPKVSIRFNIPSIEKYTYATMTGKKLGLNNAIKSVVDCRKNDIKTEIHMLPTKLNINDLYRQVEYILSDLKVNKIKILRLIYHGRAIAFKNVLKYDTNKLNDILIKLKKKYKNKIEYSESFPINNINSKRKCTAYINKMMITCDLMLYPCTSFKKQDMIGIPITNKHTLRKIINDNTHLKIMKKINKYVNDNCYKTVENNGNTLEMCPAQRYIFNKLEKNH